MPYDATQAVSGSDLSAALRLGFFARYFDQEAFVDALELLHTRIAPSILLRLREAVRAAGQTSGNGASGDEAIIALADRALPFKEPCHVVYDLGAALGACQLQRVEAGSSFDSSTLWDCVRHIPRALVGVSVCLHDLAEEAKGNHDLDTVLRRASRPWTEMLATDDDDEYRANYARLVSASPPWVKRALGAHRHSAVIIFLSKLDGELAEAQVPTGSVAPELFVPTPLQERILAALDGRALQTKALAKASACEETKLFKPGGVSELKEVGLVAHKDGVGYFRPDKPPAGALYVRKQ